MAGRLSEGLVKKTVSFKVLGQGKEIRETKVFIIFSLVGWCR